MKDIVAYHMLRLDGRYLALRVDELDSISMTFSFYDFTSRMGNYDDMHSLTIL